MSDRAPAADDDVLEFVTPAGHSVVHQAKFGTDHAGPNPACLTRAVVLSQGWTVEQRRLRTTAPAADHDLLDAEIGAGVVLDRRYGDTDYPDVLPRLVGFGVDTDEPFILYEPAPGRTAAEVAGALGVSQLNEFGRSLFRALRLLSAVGLVHRGISPQSVVWDGAVARLLDLATVGFTGQARHRMGAAPWAPPEQCLGQGTVDPGDDVWSVGRLLAHMSAGPVLPGRQSVPGRSALPDPMLRRLLDGVFDERAVNRPDALTLLSRSRGADPLDPSRGGLSLAPDPLEERHTVVEEMMRSRQTPEPLPPATARSRRRFAWRGGVNADSDYTPAHASPSSYVSSSRPVSYGAQGFDVIQCPQCLDPIRFDPDELYIRDGKRVFQKVELQPEWNEKIRNDVIRGAHQKCANRSGIDDHYLPTAFLIHGRPLTIAMVGRSAAGKSHLLGAMAGEIEAGALAPYGIGCRAANSEEHSAFVREYVNPLRAGQLLARTRETSLPALEDVILLARGNEERPVAFFDISGENLVRSDAATRFLTGVDALIFVVDPVRACQLPVLDDRRQQLGVAAPDMSDPTFATVLDRLNRTSGFVDVPAAIAIAKSDLIRHEPPVTRWLGDQADPRSRPAAVREETRDALAFLNVHAGQGWLRPAIDCRSCTAHFVTATGSGASGEFGLGFGTGTGARARRGGPEPETYDGIRSRRVLEPLLSILAMCGLLDGQSAESGFQSRGGGR